jgi:DNA-binding CsgD family transcriptional regulator
LPRRIPSEAAVLATVDVPSFARPSSASRAASASSARPRSEPRAVAAVTGALPALDGALRALFTPLDYPDVRGWLEAARAAVRALTGVDVAVPPCVLDSQPGWDAVERAFRTAVLDDVADDAREPHRAAIVRAVLPAIRAGFAAWRQVAARRAELAAVLDALADSVLLYDAAGELAHANPKGRALVDCRTAGARVRAEAQRIAWTMSASARRSGDAAVPSVVREVRVGASIYRLRGTIAPAWMLGAAAGVLVTATVESAAPLSDADLRERFGLTPREVQVARLLGAGFSNHEIAAELGVSFFTARNHVERLLAKLGLASRSRVGPLLRNEAA